MFIIFGMLVFLIFINKLYASIALLLYMGVFYKNKGKVESMILLSLCLALSLSHSYLPSNNIYKGKVDKIHDYGFVLSGFAYKVYVSTDYMVGLGDNLIIKGELLIEDKPSFNRHIGKIEDMEILKHKKTNNIRKYIYNKHPKQFEMMFDSSNDHIINSLGLQMMGIYAIYCLLYRRYFGDLKYEKIFLICLSFLFGRSFMWWRLFLKSFKVTSNHQIIFLLILFPNAITSPSFIYAYSLYLLGKFTDEFKELESSLLFAQLSLFFFNEWHAMSLLFYPILKYVSGVYTLLILFTCFVPPLNYILTLLQTTGTFIINSSIYQRFLIRGSLHFLSFFIILFTRNKKEHYIIFMMMLILVVYPPFARITYIDVGQGDSTLVSLPFNVSHYLVDTGRAFAYNNVKRNLKKHGVSNLNYLVLTHDDADHVENKAIIIKEFMPRYVMEDKHQTIEFMHSHLQDVNFGDDNENSIVLSFQVHGIRYLLLGDAHKKQEELILKEDPEFRVNILKLGHHGSDTSTSNQLLKVSKAKIAIISSKPSVYNHPRPEVMRRLFNHNILPIQTSSDGDITVYSSALLQYIKTSEGSFAIIDKGD